MASPESEGQHQLSLQGGLHEVHSVTITSSIATVEVSKSAHPADPVATAGVSGAYGLMDRLDLGADLELGVVPLFFTKYQLWGEPKRKAQPGNFSFALLAGIGSDAASTSSDTGIFGATPGSIHRDASSLIEAGAIMGYRTSSHVILLAGSSVLWQDIEGDQTLGNSASPIHFKDHSRYTEIHGAGYFTADENTGHSFFITPSVQWGWTDSFGNRNYLTTIQVDVGTQF